MSTVDIVGLLIPVTYFVFLAVETLWPAREFPTRRGWQWVGIAFLLVVGTLSTVVPLRLTGRGELGKSVVLDHATVAVTVDTYTARRPSIARRPN